MGTQGVTIINKNEYLDKVKNEIFGGLLRKMKIESVEQIGIITSVKLRIESSENNFISYNSLVLDAYNRKKIMNNLTVIKAKE